MIVCVIEDLLFSIKISTAAKSLAVPIFFERRADQVLPRIRELHPALVVFDLNCERLEPMAAVAAIKADPALADVRTLGYAAHVQADVIAAARRAGIDRVLARSAFAEKLGEILTQPAANSRQ